MWRKIVTSVCGGVPGVVWGQTFLVEPVAFGVRKLVFTCVVEDRLVPALADLTDPIEQQLSRAVQSVQVVAMTKLPSLVPGRVQVAEQSPASTGAICIVYSFSLKYYHPLFSSISVFV